MNPVEARRLIEQLAREFHAKDSGPDVPQRERDEDLVQHVLVSLARPGNEYGPLLETIVHRRARPVRTAS